MGKSRKSELHPGEFSHRIISVIVPTVERGCFQPLLTMQHPFSGPRPPPRLREIRVMKVTGWSRRSPTLAGSLFATMALLGTLTEKGTLIWGVVEGVWRRSVAASLTEKGLGCRPPNRIPGLNHLMHSERMATGHGCQTTGAINASFDGHDMLAPMSELLLRRVHEEMERSAKRQKEEAHQLKKVMLVLYKEQTEARSLLEALRECRDQRAAMVDLRRDLAPLAAAVQPDVASIIEHPTPL